MFSIKECAICGVLLATSHGNTKYCAECAVNPDRMRKKYERAVYFNKLRFDDTRKPVTRACNACGREFMTMYESKRFCGPMCNTAYRLEIARCLECNELLASKGVDKERGYCSDVCRQAAKLRRAKATGNYIACPCCGEMFIRKSVSNKTCSKECRDVVRQAKQANTPNPVKEKKPTIRYVKCSCCGCLFDSALMKNGVKYCSDHCRDTKLAAEAAKALKNTVKQNSKQATHICISCRTSQKDCERFTSNFVYTPTGAKQQIIEGKSIIVACPKFR